MGDTDGHLARAVAAIRAMDGVTVCAVSSIYRTEPQEKKEQPWFANQVALVACQPHVTPQILMRSLLAIESSMGRCRDGNAPEDRFGPRVIDLDMLLFGSVQIETPLLTLPHPRMHQRAFVLVPLHEIAPECTFPDGRTLVQTLDALHYRVEGDKIWQ